MRRREFVSLLGATAVASPFSARAQPNAKLPTIGVLGVATALGWKPSIAAFVQRLSDLGWVEGRNVNIEYRWAEGHSERFADCSRECRCDRYSRWCGRFGKTSDHCHSDHLCSCV